MASPTAGAHVLVVAEARYAAQLQPSGLVEALIRRGVPVRYRLLGSAEEAPAEDLDWAHVVVGRGRSADLLAFLELAAAHGRPVVDGAEAVRSVHDKARLSQALLGAGVPTPATWFGSVVDLAERVPAEAFPLILKPVFGDNARGLQVVETAEALRGTAWPEDPALAQSYLPSDGADLKVYVIGEEMAAIRKPSPFTPGAAFAAHGVPLTAELADLARRCGELFGLSVFGVDCLPTPDGPVVVEVNDFPNFTGVPGADDLLASHCLAAAGGPVLACAAKGSVR
ncbi:MAG: ATP-grasp domain-containing protein [Sporichthyaceae bacterium]